jgi:hypothetical protein
VPPDAVSVPGTVMVTPSIRIIPPLPPPPPPPPKVWFGPGAHPALAQLPAPPAPPFAVIVPLTVTPPVADS